MQLRKSNIGSLWRTNDCPCAEPLETSVYHLRPIWASWASIEAHFGGLKKIEAHFFEAHPGKIEAHLGLAIGHGAGARKREDRSEQSSQSVRVQLAPKTPEKKRAYIIRKYFAVVFHRCILGFFC